MINYVKQIQIQIEFERFVHLANNNRLFFDILI